MASFLPVVLCTVWVCLVPSLSLAQAPACQCVPEKFTVTAKSLVVAVDPKSTPAKMITIAENTRLAFDSMSQMSGMFVNVTFFDGTPSYHYRIITDYTQHTQWLIHPEMQACDKNRYTNPIQRCLPSDAIYIDFFYIGYKDLYADQWDFNVSLPGITGLTTFAFLRDMCVPLGELFIGQENGVQVTVTSEYVNYENGIFDPDEFFKIPDFCAKATNSTRKTEGRGNISKLVASHRYHSIPRHLFL